MSAYIGAVRAASVIYNVASLKYSIKTEKQFICTTKARFKFKESYKIDFSLPAGCLFAINDNFSYYFMWIYSFHRLNIYQSVLPRFSLVVLNLLSLLRREQLRKTYLI